MASSIKLKLDICQILSYFCNQDSCHMSVSNHTSVSDHCLMSWEQTFRYIRTSYTSMRWWRWLSHECEWSLFDTKRANFQVHVYHGENKLYFNEMMKILALYQPNMMSWIFIETYRNNSLKANMSLFKHFLKFKPSNFAATPYCSMLHVGRKQQKPIS